MARSLFGSMKVIIPAKASSSRVINKNWRPFYGEQSLVDITITKLRNAGCNRKDIYVSCEDTRLLMECRRTHGVQTLNRSIELCKNETDITKVVRSICGELADETEIGYAQVCSPTFDEYRDCFDKWIQHRSQFDSLAVAYAADSYVMMSQQQTMNPLGWSFGNCHPMSQRAAKLYTMPFAFSILTQRSLRETGYYCGRNPIWHVAAGNHIDIDTMQDFEDAQAIYAARQAKPR